MGKYRIDLRRDGRTLALGLKFALGLAALPLLAGGEAQAAQSAAAQAAPAAEPPKPSTLSGSYLSALHAQRNGDWRSAVFYLDQSLARQPDDAQLLRRAYRLLLGFGQVDRAVALAHRLPVDDPNVPLVPVALAAEALKAGKARDALAALDKLPKGSVGQLLAEPLRAWAEAADGRADAGFARLAKAAGEEKPTGLVLLHAGLLAEATGRTAEAEGFYRKALGDNAPLRAVQALAGLLHRGGRSAEALSILERYEQTYPDSPLVETAREAVKAGRPLPALAAGPAEGAAEVLYDLATALQQDRVLEMATLCAQLSLYLKPDHALAHLLLAEVATLREQFPEAQAHYDRILAAKAPDAGLASVVRLRSAEVLDKLGRQDDAIAQLEALAAARPQDPAPLLQLGDLYRRTERPKEAVATYDAAAARMGAAAQNQWSFLYSRGMALERAGDFARAEADLLRAIELQPDYPFLLNYLAYSWVDRGLNLDRASAMLEEAVKLKPHDGFIVDSLGWAFFRRGDYERAVVELERAAGLEPYDPTINDHLGDALWKVGRKREARYMWKRSREFAREPALVQSLDTKLGTGLAALQ